MDIKKVFGKNVKTYRLNAGLSQENLAEKADISTQTLSGIENGYGFPSYPVLCRLINALNVAPVNLFIFYSKEFSNEKIIKFILEEFKNLDSEEQNLILHIMKYLREAKRIKK